MEGKESSFPPLPTLQNATADQQQGEVPSISDSLRQVFGCNVQEHDDVQLEPDSDNINVKNGEEHDDVQLEPDSDNMNVKNREEHDDFQLEPDSDNNNPLHSEGKFSC